MALGNWPTGFNEYHTILASWDYYLIQIPAFANVLSSDVRTKVCCLHWMEQPDEALG